jgi:hypothetical protein
MLDMFAWNPKYTKPYDDITWHRHYAALLHYWEKYGHCNLRDTDTYVCTLKGMGPDGSEYQYKDKLGKWMRNQRSFARKGILNPDRKAKLQQLVDQSMYTCTYIHINVDIDNINLSN